MRVARHEGNDHDSFAVSMKSGEQVSIVGHVAMKSINLWQSIL